MIPKIGLSEGELEKSINLLAIVLSDEMTLYIKTRKFHWNVAGQSFMELHKLFEAQYSELEQLIDGSLDSSGRDLKNVLMMMKRDGLDKEIGEYRYPDFLIPFKKLIEREKQFINI